MSCLVYCILRDGGPIAGNLPVGMDGETVSLVSDGGLSAACSAVPDEFITPSVCRARAYAQVVGELHAACTVLPVRYGSVLGTQAQVARLLRQRASDFHAALRRLDGCDEMGIRMMLTRAEPAGPVQPSALRDFPAGAGGAAYLHARARFYAEDDGNARAAAEEAERCKAAFSGLFAECKTEPCARHNAVSGAALLSLHFLVRRECEVDFRRTFRTWSRGRGRKSLLTGPWPPYNFAGCCEERERPAGLPDGILWGLAHLGGTLDRSSSV